MGKLFMKKISTSREERHARVVVVISANQVQLQRAAFLVVDLVQQFIEEEELSCTWNANVAKVLDLSLNIPV